MPFEWVKQYDYEDIIYETYNGIAKITINRPEVHNAFRPKTVNEMIDAFTKARDDSNIGVIILTGAGGKAFCSGGDQKVRGHGGYVGEDEIPRLNVLDLQRLIRVIPKPVIAMVAGYAIGGGHVLHVVCDLTIAADNAIFGQTGPKVGSFDGGYGAGYLARIVGHKKAREIWYLCRQYNAQEALEMGLVNKVVRAAGRRNGQMGARNFGEKPDRHSLLKSGVQRRFRRPGRHSAACGRCDASILYDGRGERRNAGVQGKTEAGLRPVPAFPVRTDQAA